MPEINGVMLPFMPVGGASALKTLPDKIKSSGNLSSSNFNKIFENELSKIKFSGHANTRMESRNIELSGTDLQRMTTAVDKAREKGSNESLIMMDENAFIVNLNNNTVKTAFSNNDMHENVITNIDSAIFA